MMEDLLKYHIEDTSKRFDHVSEELGKIHHKLDALQEFKTVTIVSTRWVSFVVSTVCGLVTMIATACLNYFLTTKK